MHFNGTDYYVRLFSSPLLEIKRGMEESDAMKILLKENKHQLMLIVVSLVKKDN
jgi:hypothetical protein